MVEVGEEGAGSRRSLSLPRALSGNMAAVEEAASSGSLLNGDLDPDDREEGAASTAEEAAKKKRRKKKKSKGAATGKGTFMFFPGMAERLGSGPAWVSETWDSEPWSGLIPGTERVARPGYRVSAPRGGGFSSRGAGELVEAWGGRAGSGRSASLAELALGSVGREPLSCQNSTPTQTVQRT